MRGERMTLPQARKNYTGPDSCCQYASDYYSKVLGLSTKASCLVCPFEKCFYDMTEFQRLEIIQAINPEAPLYQA